MSGVSTSPSQKFIDFRHSFNRDTIQFYIVDRVDDQLWNGFLCEAFYALRPAAIFTDFLEIADALR